MLVLFNPKIAHCLLRLRSCSGETNPLRASLSPIFWITAFKLDSYTGLQHLIVKDNKWGFFSLLFSKFQAAELGQEFTLTVPELPDTMDSYAAIVIGENYQDVGTPVCICHMVGKILHCTPVQKYYNYGNGGRFCISWFVLNDPIE